MKRWQKKTKNLPVENIRNRMSISGDWWKDKTHVLVDMDGTLIGQPGALFSNLFAVLAFMRLKPLAGVKEVIKAIYKGNKVLLSSHSFPSNQDAWYETIASELQVKRDQVERFAQRFFDSDYPFICLFLHSEPHARRLVDLLHASSRHITLATNAVFGRREIELRLKASDLYLHDFDLVTSWDNMHTTKPHKNFFSETLTKIGATPENTIMIGNDPYYDLPAHQLGITTLLVGPKLSIKDIADSLEEDFE